jgi:hypothetical protein
MELSRRFDGSIGIAGMDDRYDRSATEDPMAWGTFFALTYTYPRKHLQLFGAPRSKWAKSMPLPRPWGNAADDLFHSMLPIPGGPLTVDDLKNETVETGASLAVLNKLSDPNLTNETLLKYIHHPEYDLRSGAMAQVVSRGKVEMVVPLLKSGDPRLRQAGLLAITGMFKGSALANDKVTPEMYELAGKMINDPNESWWVAQHAIMALGRGSPALIAKHRDRLLQLMKTDCTWMKTAAIVTLAKIAGDPAHAKSVLPAIIETAAGLRVASSSYRASTVIAEAIKSAPAEVKAFATPLLKKTYDSLPNPIVEPKTGAVMSSAAKVKRSQIGAILQQVPGGDDFVKMLPRSTLASYVTGKDLLMYAYSGKFTPNPAVLGTWAWAVYPQPNKPSEVEDRIRAYLKGTKGKDPTVIDKPKDTLQLLDQGKVAKSKYFSGYFWSGNMLIGVNDDQALQMEVRTVDGVDFLVIERGGFNSVPDTEEAATAGVPKDWHCGYSVYVKQK